MNILLLSPYPRHIRVKEFLISEGHTVIVRTDVISLEMLQEHAIDYLISYGYAPIIKEPIITEYRHKIINLHNSYLPYGRGIYPIVWSILDNTPIGVTVHLIDAGIDSGAILFQNHVSISDNDTLQSAWDTLNQAVEDLFCLRWNDIVTHNFHAISQSDCDSVGAYHTRQESEKMMSHFPNRWQTTVADVKKLRKEMLDAKIHSEGIAP